MSSDPIKIFAEWFKEAKQTIAINPNAAALATATTDGKPSVRMILLKNFDEHGFVFYTNLNSKKAKELAENPQAALCYYWQDMNKQVRIEGKVEQVSKEEADKYFASRARESQIGTWSSNQSQPLSSLQELDQRFRDYTEQFKDKEIPRPEFWSGFRIVPDAIEFWKLGKYRLHERVCYKKTETDEWISYRLYP